MKYNAFPSGVRNSGVDEPEGLISFIMCVPAALPSLIHSSLPWTPSSAVKNSWVDGEVRTWELDPAAHGIGTGTLDDLRGGDAARNAEIAQEVLGGAAGPCTEIVVLNAAAGLVVGGQAPDLDAGIELARASLAEGRAAAALAALVRVSQEAAAAEHHPA